MNRPRIAVFLDGSSFFHLQKDRLHWWIDPKRLLHWIKQRGEVVDAFYYLAIDHAHADPQQDGFLKALSYMGYAVVAREIRGDAPERRRPNLAVDIVMDLLTLADNYDVAAVVSGDGDLERPLAALRARGKRSLVVSAQGFAARELRAFAGMHFVDVQEIRAEVEKQQVPAVEKPPAP